MAKRKQIFRVRGAHKSLKPTSPAARRLLHNPSPRLKIGPLTDEKAEKEARA